MSPERFQPTGAPEQKESVEARHKIAAGTNARMVGLTAGMPGAESARINQQFVQGSVGEWAAGARERIQSRTVWRYSIKPLRIPQLFPQSGLPNSGS